MIRARISGPVHCVLHPVTPNCYTPNCDTPNSLPTVAGILCRPGHSLGGKAHSGCRLKGLSHVFLLRRTMLLRRTVHAPEKLSTE